MRRTAVAIATTLLTVVSIAIGSGANADTGATILTLNVTGCEGCVVQALQYQLKGNKSYESDPVKVRNGVATFGVQTSKTKGMYFSITTAKPLRIDALPIVTVQYLGVKPGTTVTKSKAKASKWGSACWAGTKKGTATLDITVKRIVMASFPNTKKKVSVPLAFFQPSVKAYGGFNPAYKGLLATQDVWLCGPGTSHR